MSPSYYWCIIYCRRCLDPSTRHPHSKKTEEGICNSFAEINIFLSRTLPTNDLGRIADDDAVVGDVEID